MTTTAHQPRIWPLASLAAASVAALAVVLASCGSDPASEPAPTLTAASTTTAAATTSTPSVASPTPSTDPRYDSCADANEAGYGPYRRDVDPEYEWYEDRDGDGVVCETE
jgi:excalibur calcium-binding domain-containing protein